MSAANLTISCTTNLQPSLHSKEHLRRLLCMLLSILGLSLVLTGSILGQNDSLPTFSAIESHEFDSIDLQNLTIMLNTPVMNKSGAIPFSYSLHGSNSCARGSSWSC